MGKVTLEGLMKPGDPMHKQQSIVLGGLRGKAKKPSPSDESNPKAEKPASKGD